MKTVLYPVFFVLALSLCSCKKSSDAGPVDAIAGTYTGTMYQDDYYRYGSGVGATTSSSSTSSPFSFVIRKVSGNLFTANPYYDLYSENIHYDPSNLYSASIASAPGGGVDSLIFFPAADSIYYNSYSVDEEGGGTSYWHSHYEWFSGKKQK